jgi:hypothetical protein
VTWLFFRFLVGRQSSPSSSQRQKSIYLACIGWIIVDAAIVIHAIVRQYEKLLSQLAS